MELSQLQNLSKKQQIRKCKNDELKCLDKLLELVGKKNSCLMKQYLLLGIINYEDLTEEQLQNIKEKYNKLNTDHQNYSKKYRQKLKQKKQQQEQENDINSDSTQQEMLTQSQQEN